MLWKSDLENGYFRNPVLYTDYSDPDVIRVEDTFYMTASSFNCIPGLPVLASKDLINWNILNYAVRNIPYQDYDLPALGRGIWAPSIRYHKGKFWIFVGMPDEGIFMTNTDNPSGTWSPLTCIREGKGFIDPCPIWDDDGNAYVVHAYAKSRIGFKSKLGLFPIEPETAECTGEDIFIFDGTKTQPTIEGPKIYKRDGAYYIFAPAGGVETGWQTVLRSKSITGPYEEKIVMHQGDSQTNGPHQGGLVDTPDGQEWFLHFQDRGVYGRIVHAQPVSWENEWPVIGVNPDSNGVGTPADVLRKPTGCALQKPEEPQSSDDFENSQLGLQWQWMANEKPEFHSLTEKKGKLRLKCLNPGGKKAAPLTEYPNVLTQKTVCPSFTVKTAICISELRSGDRTGLTIIGGRYAALEVIKREDGLFLRYIESSPLKEGPVYEETITETRLDSSIRDIELNLYCKNGGVCCFWCSDPASGAGQVSRPFNPGKGYWVGAKIGMYGVTSGASNSGGQADFDHFTITSL